MLPAPTQSRFAMHGPRTPRVLAAAPLLAGVLTAGLAYTQQGGQAQPRPIPCATLAELALADTAITLAEALPAGANPAPVGMLPTAICRVVGISQPAINFEVWLPTETWNGKFQGVGNRGTAGAISYAAMRAALGRGYATASTDAGYASSGSFDPSWALRPPERIADFGHRGLHVTTVNAKQIIRAFYGRHPDHSYFVGCSKGGQQALMEAQRYPEDYDGIIGGDPANNWTRLYAGAHLWYSIAMLNDPKSYIPAAKIALLGDAVTAACDAIDGVIDGVLDDPRKCAFDPAVLTCKEDQDRATCYTPRQVKAINDIWNGVRNSRGELVHRPIVRGGEAGAGGWAAWITGSEPFAARHWLAVRDFFGYQVFGNPNFNAFNFNFDADLDFALAKVGPVLDASDPDLRPFRTRGGKLLMYHGWSDPDISPLNTVDYYESVISTFKLGEQTRDEASQDVRGFARLFMVPGMQHCSGGPGPNRFDMLTALENWVEKGEAPNRIIASLVTDTVVTRTRPLCPYPQVAVYAGSGSTDDATNFVCSSPEAQGDQRQRPQGFEPPSAPMLITQSSAPTPSAPAESAALPSAPAESAPPPSAPASSGLAATTPASSALPSTTAPSATLAPTTSPPSALTGQAPPPAPPAGSPNHAPIWESSLLIDFVEGVPAVISVREFVRDPDSDPLVITLKSGALLPGMTWNPTDYTIVYDGRPMGASDGAPIEVTGLVFTADDGRPAATAQSSAPAENALPASAPAPGMQVPSSSGPTALPMSAIAATTPPPSAPAENALPASAPAPGMQVPSSSGPSALPLSAIAATAPPPSASTVQPPPAAPSAGPPNRGPIWDSAPTIVFVEGVAAVVSVRDYVRDPDSDPLVITLKSGELVPGLTWNPTDYTIVYDGRPMGARDDAPIEVTGVIFDADNGKP